MSYGDGELFQKVLKACAEHYYFNEYHDQEKIFNDEAKDNARKMMAHDPAMNKHVKELSMYIISEIAVLFERGES